MRPRRPRRLQVLELGDDELRELVVTGEQRIARLL
jgi:hypothetical protein